MAIIQLKLTQPFHRPYVVNQYLQQRKIDVTPENQRKIDEQVSLYLAQIPVNIKDLYVFLDKLN